MRPQPNRERYANGVAELEIQKDEDGTPFLYVIKSGAGFLMFYPEDFVDLVELLGAWYEEYVPEEDEEDG